MDAHRDALIAEPFAQEPYEEALEQALSSAETRIYLDTSTLIWLYRLHETPRREFLEWIDTGPQAGRIHIPRRALHEFSRHRRDSKVLLPFKGVTKGVPRLIKQLRQLAHLTVDDAVARANGFGSRSEYLAEVARLEREAQRLVRPLSNPARLEELDAELVPAFNSLALKGDIFGDLTALRAAYEARCEIRLPPGFLDQSKGTGRPPAGEEEDEDAPVHAGANRFGDFAIWNEILGHLAELGGEHGDVLILTHDQKPDWSYTPQKLLDSAGRSSANEKDVFRVTTAQPMLCHEARLRAGVSRLFVQTIPQFAKLCTKRALPITLEALARAVQAEEEAARSQDEGAGATNNPISEATAEAPQAVEVEEQADPAPPEVPEPAQVPARVAVDQPGTFARFVADLPAQAVADRIYRGDPQGSRTFEDVIRRLRSQNWYTQNAATTEGIEALAQGEPTLLQTFIFGRNLWQAAAGAASTPIESLANFERVFGSVPEAHAQVVYAGTLMEAYFDKEGRIRPRPKGRDFGPLFAPQDLAVMAPVAQWIGERLAEHASAFLALPSAVPPIIRLNVSFDTSGHLAGLSHGAIALSKVQESGDNSVRLPARLDLERLLSRIARHFSVPENQLLVDPPFVDAVEVAPNLALIDWGTDTGVQLVAR